MRYLLTLVLLFGLTASECYAQLGSSTNLFTFKKFEDNPIQKSLVRIHANGEQGVGLGSGALIGKDLILTAYHVVRGATTIDVLVPHKAFRFKDAKLLYFDVGKDLAVLKAALPKAVKPLTVSETVPKQGETIQFLGFAGGQLPRHFDCKVLDVDNLAKQLLLDSQVIQGDSGGMMLNSKGEIVGCIQKGMVSITRISHLEGDTLYNPLLLALTTGCDCRTISDFLKANE